ncbi:hypothetical protein GCM10023195_09020 [Actinoallomurus liliacearum]|uniref:Uncharacterized protein n=1 Tax=Actinoallomurus liliacearum TaxID=1080073 RepID=A0ABP8TCS3_9ACTN
MLLCKCHRFGGQHGKLDRKLRRQSGAVRAHPGREQLPGGRLDEARATLPPSLPESDQLDRPAGEVHGQIRQQIERRVQQRHVQRGRHRVGETFAAVQVGAPFQVGRDRRSGQRAHVHTPPHSGLRQEPGRRGRTRRQQK